MRVGLRAAGSAMALAANCLFFVDSLANVPALFTGFSQASNVAAPPPPSRTEFVARSLCAGCVLTAKCVGVLEGAGGRVHTVINQCIYRSKIQ